MPRSAASGGSCSTASAAEIHPYDVTVERPGAAEAYDCKWGARGINADVLHQLDDARTHAADEDERLDGRAGRLRCRSLLRGPARSPDRADRGHAADRASRRSTSSPVRRDDHRTRRGRRRVQRAVPRALRRGGAGRAAPDVRPAAATPRTSPGSTRRRSASTGAGTASTRLTWLVRAANVAVLGAIPVGAALTGTTRVVGFRRVWSRRHSEFRDAAGGLAATVDIDWVLVDDRGVPTRIPPIFEATFKVPAGTLVLGRVALDDPPADAHRHGVHGPAAGAGPDGPRQQRRSTPTGSTRPSSPRATRSRSARSRGRCGWSTRWPRNRARRSRDGRGPTSRAGRSGWPTAPGGDAPGAARAVTADAAAVGERSAG